MQVNSDTYSNLFINDIPLMDVRAPIEFLRGAFPTAKNLPLMDNKQREEVGAYYKKHGQDLAIQKGQELVKGEIREKRIADWVEFSNNNPNAHLYCFRGGLRSKITQQWINEAGAHIPMVFGGYKALRTFLLNELNIAAEQCSLTLIGGKTGSAKTILISQLNNGVDLESAAHHRGSSFGRYATEQSTQINFENQLAIDLLKLKDKNIQKIVLEDEARTIGRVGIPISLFEKMRNSPLVVIEEPFDARLERLLKEYIVDMLAEFQALDTDKSFSKFSSYLLQSLEKIQKRLGPVRYKSAHHAMQLALFQQNKVNDLAGHYDWLKIILENYYDPMYEDQLEKRKEHIVFRGNYNECREYLEHAF